MQARRSPVSTRGSGSSPGRARVKLGTRVDDLLEENLSLKYQVQKLQAVLSSGSRTRRGEGGGSDEDEEEKFKSQIKRLQVFMNDHSTQSTALKEKLREAAEAAEALERGRGREAGAGRASSGTTRKRSAKRSAKAAKAGGASISDALRAALGDSYKGARGAAGGVSRTRGVGQHRGRSAAQGATSSGRSSGVSGAPTGKRKQTRAKRDDESPPGGRGHAASGKQVDLGVTSKDLEYIFDEVVSLKHKLAEAERKLHHSEEVNRHHPPQIHDEILLKQEMESMKESQERLIKQISAQQEVLASIFRHLSLSGMVPKGVRFDVSGAAANSKFDAGCYGDEDLHQTCMYGTRHPGVMSTKTALSKGSRLQGKQSSNILSRARNTLRNPVIRTRRDLQRNKSAERDKKFSLLSAGCSTYYMDDPKYVERALNFDRAACSDFEDF